MSSRPFALRRASGSPHALPSLSKLGLPSPPTAVESTTTTVAATLTGTISPAHPGTPGRDATGPTSAATTATAGQAWQSYLSPSLFTSSALHTSTSDLRSTSRPPSPGGATGPADKQREVNLFEQSFGSGTPNRPAMDGSDATQQHHQNSTHVVAPRHAGLAGTMTPGRESKLRNVSSRIDDDDVAMLDDLDESSNNVAAAAAAAAALVGVLSSSSVPTTHQQRQVSLLPRRPTLQESRSSELSIATSTASVATRMTTLTTPDRSPPASPKPTTSAVDQAASIGQRAMRLDLQDLSLTLPARQSSFSNSPAPSFRTHLMGSSTGATSRQSGGGGMHTPDFTSGSMTPGVLVSSSGATTPSYLTSSLTRLVDEPEKVLSPPLAVEMMNGYIPSGVVHSASLPSSSSSSSVNGGGNNLAHVQLPPIPPPPAAVSVTTSKRGRKHKSAAVVAAEDAAEDEVVADDDDEYTESSGPSASKVRRIGSVSAAPSPRRTGSAAGAIDLAQVNDGLAASAMTSNGDATEAGLNGTFTVDSPSGGGGAGGEGTAKLSALERNRIAASKSRKRKRERMQNMEQVATDLSNANASLQATALELKSELFMLRSQLAALHPDQSRCPCVHVQGYLKRERSGQGIQVIIELSGETLNKQYGDVGKWGRGGGADANGFPAEALEGGGGDNQLAGAVVTTATTSGRARGTKRTRAAALEQRADGTVTRTEDVDELESDS
ncbi:hypothetical protein ACM66B_004410 [Microbotryomycetes sp. NB124-2]